MAGGDAFGASAPPAASPPSREARPPPEAAYPPIRTTAVTEIERPGAATVRTS